MFRNTPERRRTRNGKGEVRAVAEMDNETEDIRICSDPSELAAVRARVTTQAEAAGFGDTEVNEIALAVDEALANVIRHGYGGPCDQPIEIRLERINGSEGDAIHITIRDFGRQVDPTQIAGRALEDIKPGGLGVHIIRTVMDQVTYTPADGGGMQLIMTKKRKEQ